MRVFVQPALSHRGTYIHSVVRRLAVDTCNVHDGLNVLLWPCDGKLSTRAWEQMPPSPRSASLPASSAVKARVPYLGSIAVAHHSQHSCRHVRLRAARTSVVVASASASSGTASSSSASSSTASSGTGSASPTKPVHVVVSDARSVEGATVEPQRRSQWRGKREISLSGRRAAAPAAPAARARAASRFARKQQT